MQNTYGNVLQFCSKSDLLFIKVHSTWYLVAYVISIRCNDLKHITGKHVRIVNEKLCDNIQGQNTIHN